MGQQTKGCRAKAMARAKDPNLLRQEKVSRGQDNRSRITITAEQMIALMHFHVPDPVNEDGWLKEDSQQIIKRYALFLQALISLTDRVSHQELKRCVKEVWDLIWDMADAWAHKVHLAFRSLVSTSRHMVDGTKMDPEIATVAGTFKRKLSRSLTPSQRSASPADTVERERTTMSQEALASSIWDTPRPLKKELPASLEKEPTRPPSISLGPITSGDGPQNANALRLWGILPAAEEKPRDTDEAKPQVRMQCLRP